MAELGDVWCSGQHEICMPERCFCNLPWCDHLAHLTRKEKLALLEGRGPVEFEEPPKETHG